MLLRAPAGAEFVARVREIAAARIGESGFGVAQLAKALGVGRTQLFEQMAQLMDRAPREFLFELRLERAATLLVATDLPVGAVSRSVGFRTLAHFTHRFRARFGTTPSTWRRERRTAAAAPGQPAG